MLLDLGARRRSTSTAAGRRRWSATGALVNRPREEHGYDLLDGRPIATALVLGSGLIAAILAGLLPSALRVVSGTLFFPRGGSAFVTRALARGLADDGRRGHGARRLAPRPRRPRRRAPLLRRARPARGRLHARARQRRTRPASTGPDGTAPLQPSFEDRPGAPDRIFAALDDAAYEHQVAAWSRELLPGGRGRGRRPAPAPPHAAERGGRARSRPGVPVVAHLHGTELLMLEAIARDPRRWAHGPAWAARLRTWAAAARRLVVAPGGRDRAAGLLGVPVRRFVTLAERLRPARVPAPRGRPPRGLAPRARRGAARLAAGRRARERALRRAGASTRIARGPVILYVGRFTEVKRLGLLLEAFAAARPRMAEPASLILVGGHPGEWEGEHPADAIERLGVPGVLLAGWYDQSELPELLAAADLLVLPSARESFGQVIVEAMACGVPAVAAASLGPAKIIRRRQDRLAVRRRRPRRAAPMRSSRRRATRPSGRGARRPARRRRSRASPGRRSRAGSTGSCVRCRARSARRRRAAPG